MAAIPFNHTSISAGGTKLHSVQCGAGKTILFLHGFPEFWYAWKNQLEHFGKDYRAIALDLPGYNLSDKPTDLAFYSMDNLAEVLAQAIKSISNSQKIILVAHDWGGVLSWRIAIKFPELLEKLVIINSPHPCTYARELLLNPAQRKASSYIPVMRSKKAEEFLRANDFAYFQKAVFNSCSKADAFDDADRKAYIEAWSQPGALTASLNYYRAINPLLLLSAVTANVWGADAFTVRVPTLVIWGEKDRAITKNNLNGLERFVPDLTIKRISDSSHWVMHESPDLVNQYIREFLVLDRE